MIAWVIGMMALYLAALTALKSSHNPLTTSLTFGPRARTTVASATADLEACLEDCRSQLRGGLRIEDNDQAKSAEILRLHSESIMPLEHRIYLPDISPDNRKAAIVAIARSLDVVEEAARGPLLAGSKCTLADASFFPSMALFAQVLVPHFGWTPWTSEALFYRRPRLHAWFELMKYEAAAVEVEEAVEAKLQALQVNWEAVAMEVPTSRIRTFPSHTF